MKKNIFLAIFDKIFFRHSVNSVPQKKFCQIAQKMVFFIFKVILFFNDLCPFLIFKFIIIKKLKYAQTLVLYSSTNIALFIKF